MNREAISYQPTHQIFIQKDRNYFQQYAHVYCKRLLSLRPALENFLIANHVTVANRIIGLRVGEISGIIGTLFKEQKLKPCVLDEFTNDFIATSGANLRPHLENYYSKETDSLFIEDESGRCQVEGAHAVDFESQFLSRLVTGIVVACVGALNTKGNFVVTQIYFPGDCFPLPCPSRSLSTTTAMSPKYLMLSSGLLAGSASSLNHTVCLELLLTYLSNRFGNNVVHVVIAGNAIAPPPPHILAEQSLDEKVPVEVQDRLIETLREADYYLAELANVLPVELMPGEGDPCNFSLPQQPIHQCLLPCASQGCIHRVTNPHAFELGDGIRVVGHSGQPVRDAMRYVRPDYSWLQYLEASLLQYRHMAPTAPDTLSCYPFADRDPFVLPDENRIHVFFAGNAPQFSTSFVQGTRFVCVPSFAETHQVVLVNLNSSVLETRTVSFAVELEPH